MTIRKKIHTIRTRTLPCGVASTYDEMIVGFFDVAVPASLDKQHFFIRARN